MNRHFVLVLQVIFQTSLVGIIPECHTAPYHIEPRPIEPYHIKPIEPRPIEPIEPRLIEPESTTPISPDLEESFNTRRHESTNPIIIPNNVYHYRKPKNHSERAIYAAASVAVKVKEYRSEYKYSQDQLLQVSEEAAQQKRRELYASGIVVSSVVTSNLAWTAVQSAQEPHQQETQTPP